MNNKILISFLLIFFFGQGAWAGDVIKKDETLTLQQCIVIALKNHPSLTSASSTIKQAESKIGQVRSGYYPQITFQSGYSRVGPEPTSLRSDPYNRYTNTLGLNQTLFDFGKTWTQVDIASLNKESTDADFKNVTATIILGVKEAYYNFLKSKMSATVALETMNAFQKHYDIAKTFFETGRSSKIDVTSAEVNLSNSQIQLISAQNALRISRVNLNKAMGVLSAPEYSIAEEFHLEQAGISFKDALAQAYANRPDILSTRLKIDALDRSVSLNKKGHLPVLSGNANYGYAGDDTSMDKSWNVGVALTFPLFTGLSTKYAVDEAKANLEIAEANEELLRQSVYLEVQSAWLNCKDAFERIDAGKVIVRQAEENLELARGRYATGVGSSIEITDAMIKFNNAKLIYITALSDFNIAQARLEKAIGAGK